MIRKYLTLLLSAAAVLPALVSCHGTTGDDGNGSGSGEGNVQELSEEWYHGVLMMQFTSVGCQNCPVMGANLKVLQEEYPDRVTVVSFHTDYSGYTDPMTTAIGATYGSRFGVTGLPAARVAMRHDAVSSMMADLRGAVESELENLPETGVALETVLDAGAGKATMTLKCRSNKAEAYRYQFFLIEDGIVNYQLGSDEGADYVHNNVVRSTRSSNIYGERLNTGAAFVPGDEYTATWNIDLESDWDTSEMKVVAAVLRTEDDGVTYICDNIAVCPLGTSADYSLEQ